MRISVLHLVTDLSTGGTQMALLRLLERIDRRRFDHRVCCLLNGDTPVARMIRGTGSDVIDLGMRSKTRVGALWRLYGLIDDTRPAILHAWLFHAALAARLVGRLAGVPIVVSSRRAFDFEGTLREPLNRLTAPLDDRTIAVSETVRRAEIGATGAPSERVVTIYNGIAIEDYREANGESALRLRRSLGFPADRVVVGSAGRLHREKGFEHLLRAVPRVLAGAPKTVFLIAGDGEAREFLSALARQLGVSEAVVFLGERRDVVSLLPGMDVFALPSLHEGMPNAVIEAMASALPVVGTDRGGTTEVVENGVTGYLVPPADPGALADALLCILRDPARARQMGRAGRERAASTFRIDDTVAKTEALYEELLVERLGFRFANEAETGGPDRLTCPAEPRTAR